MPDPATYTGIQSAWIGFTQGMRVLLVPQPDDRPLDQYLAMRDAVFSLAESPEFLDALNDAWSPAPAPNAAPAAPAPRVRFPEVLLMELKALPLAIEVAKTAEKAAFESKGFWSRLLGRTGTTIGSMHDLAGMTDFGKGVLTLMKEVVDLFKG